MSELLAQDLENRLKVELEKDDRIKELETQLAALNQQLTEVEKQRDDAVNGRRDFRQMFKQKREKCQELSCLLLTERIQFATLTKRVKEVEELLRLFISLHQTAINLSDKYDNLVDKLLTDTEIFLSTPTSPDLVLVPKEVLEKAIDFMENTAGTYWIEVCNQLKAAYSSTNKPVEPRGE